MIRRVLFTGLSVLILMLPLAVWGENLPAKVLENGADNNSIAVSDVKVEVFGGFKFKALLSSTSSDGEGSCVLKNVPVGKNVLVRLTKAGYVTQYDVRSYSDVDVENGVTFWIGSQANINGLYAGLGETFDPKKGHVYLQITDESKEEGIDGVELSASSGNIYDLGFGDYLIANAEGASITVDIQKPGYAFDIESVTIPIHSGALTQYYVDVQSGGAIFESQQAGAVTSAPITGFIRTNTGAPIPDVSVAFTAPRSGATIRPAVKTDVTGKYYQDRFFPEGTRVKVTPTKPGFRFRGGLFGTPSQTVRSRASGRQNINFRGRQL